MLRFQIVGNVPLVNHIHYLSAIRNIGNNFVYMNTTALLQTNIFLYFTNKSIIASIGLSHYVMTDT